MEVGPITDDTVYQMAVYGKEERTQVHNASLHNYIFGAWSKDRMHACMLSLLLVTAHLSMDSE